MKFLLTGAQAYQGGKLKALDIAVENVYAVPEKAERSTSHFFLTAMQNTRI